MSENLGNLAGRKGLHTSTILETLGTAAAETGTPDTGTLERLHEEFLIGRGNLKGTVTFYDFLKPDNAGKKAYVCNGSACLTAGTQDELKKSLQTIYGPDAVGEMCCVGRCYENNAFHLQGKTFGGSVALKNIFYTPESPAHIPVANRQPAILTGPSLSVAQITNLMTNCLSRRPEDLWQEIRLSALRGRGGAGFPLATKLAACRDASGREKYIVCNADEGDPGAFSDRYLLEEQQMLVLAGMLIAGIITGAEWGVLYIRAEYPEAIARIGESIKQLYESGLAGRNILGSSFHFDFRMIKAQGAYICGEESALLSSIEGQRPEVRIRPPYPAEKGLFNQPTVVSNVETLANVPWIITHGGLAYSAIGTRECSGTKLISLDGFFNNPGLVEVPMGTPLEQVVYEVGGGFRKNVKALHIGGPLGGLVPVQAVGSLTLDFKSFADGGYLLGHASVVCIPEDFPMLRYLEHLFQFTAHESCGKCFPCRLGSVRGKEMLAKAAEGNYRIDRQLFDDLLETLESGSLCMLGGGLPLPVRNALQHFADELSPSFSQPIAKP